MQYFSINSNISYDMILSLSALGLFIILVIIGSIIINKKENKWIRNHKRPLNNKELKLYYDLEIKKYIERTYKFKKNNFKINEKYRSSLDKNGRLDNIQIEIKNVPIFITNLLLYKRHEWIAFIFCNNNYAKYIWLNKGIDSNGAYSFMDIEEMVKFAKENNCSTIIEFHNHPHTSLDGNLLIASKPDLKSAAYLKKYFNSKNISFISGLCTQKHFLIYDYSFKDTSAPNKLRLNNLKKYNLNANDFEHLKMHKKIKHIKDVKPIKLKVLNNKY